MMERGFWGLIARQSRNHCTNHFYPQQLFGKRNLMGLELRRNDKNRLSYSSETQFENWCQSYGGSEFRSPEYRLQGQAILR